MIRADDLHAANPVEALQTLHQTFAWRLACLLVNSQNLSRLFDQRDFGRVFLRVIQQIVDRERFRTIDHRLAR